MASKREKTPSRTMRNIALVICEGETEDNYLSLVRKWYRSPIKIVSHIEGNRITQQLIDKHVRNLKISATDRLDVFLMYDMDVPSVNTKLLQCKAQMLLSNPSIEIWLLLHCKDQRAEIGSEEVIKELGKSSPVWKNYKKSSFNDAQKDFLFQNRMVAIARAEMLEEFKNPSSGVYKLLRLLEK